MLWNCRESGDTFPYVPPSSTPSPWVVLSFPSTYSSLLLWSGAAFHRQSPTIGWWCSLPLSIRVAVCFSRREQDHPKDEVNGSTTQKERGTAGPPQRRRRREHHFTSLYCNQKMFVFFFFFEKVTFSFHSKKEHGSTTERRRQHHPEEREEITTTLKKERGEEAPPKGRAAAPNTKRRDRHFTKLHFHFK